MTRQRAEHAHAADRFARKIVGFLAVIVTRSRRLMGNPLARAIESHAKYNAVFVSTSQTMS